MKYDPKNETMFFSKLNVCHLLNMCQQLECEVWRKKRRKKETKASKICPRIYWKYTVSQIKRGHF